MMIPDCVRGTIVAIIDNCYLCVDPVTCELPVRDCETSGGVCNSISDGCGRGTVQDDTLDCPGDAARVCCVSNRDSSCDDGTDLLCLRPIVACNESEILAIQRSCGVCVNPATCAPWGESTCRTDMDCANDEWCNGCASGSCPFCDDCVAACQPARCASDSVLTCRCARPDCGAGNTAIVRDGCWVCVDAFTCESRRGGCGG